MTWPVWKLTAFSVSPPPPVAQFGRLRSEHFRSRSKRKLFPPSTDRLSWPIPERLESGQSTNTRWAVAPAFAFATLCSTVVCGSDPRKCAETSVDGSNLRDVVLNCATGVVATWQAVPGALQVASALYSGPVGVSTVWKYTIRTKYGLSVVRRHG